MAGKAILAGLLATALHVSLVEGAKSLFAADRFPDVPEPLGHPLYMMDNTNNTFGHAPDRQGKAPSRKTGPVPKTHRN